MDDRIIDLYKIISSKIRIYIYPFTQSSPYKNKTLVQFIDETINLKSYEWGATYKSWIYIMHYIIHSPIYTDDPSKAQFFLVPQWENIARGRNYTNDLILPFKNAIESKIYKMTHPARNHLFIYISDDTPLSDRRIPAFIKTELNSRFIRITYSGRVNGYGQYHRTDEPVCIFDPINEIVVPPGIPPEYDIDIPFDKYCVNDFDYKGTLTPDKKQIERYNFLNYMNTNTNITTCGNSYYGIHCAGWGIWSARIYNYLKMGIIPIIPSDGVILPFERFLNYRAFTIKLLSSTYNMNTAAPLEYLKNMATCARKCANGDERIDADEIKMANKLYKAKQNALDVAPWFDWNSKIPYKNPFTLLILELYSKLKHINSTSKPIYNDEYYELNNDNIFIEFLGK